MTWAIPLEDLPRQEDLPAELVGPEDDVRQFGHRLVDREFGGLGRITAGSWQSGVFSTGLFEFGGCEWLFVLDGLLQLEVDGNSHEIMPGMAAVVPKGLQCRWVQPSPVLKLFLRWDHEGDGQPSRFWHCGMCEPAPASVRFIAECERVHWKDPLRSLTLDARRRNLTLTDGLPDGSADIR